MVECLPKKVVMFVFTCYTVVCLTHPGVSCLQSFSVDLQTPPRPTRVSNLPLTPPLSRSPLRSHSLQQNVSQPSPLAPRSTRSTSAVITSPGHSRPSASPIVTRATSRSVSPSVAVGRSDSPVQQASSSRHSPSPNRSPSHSPQVTRRPGIRTESPLAASAATPMLDDSDSETDDVVTMETEKSSVVKLSTNKVNGSSVPQSVQSDVELNSVSVRVSSTSHVTRTRSESSSLRHRAASIESLETTLNIPKSATKAFRSSKKNQPPQVSRSVSKSAVKSALKSTAKSRRQHQEEDVEQTEDAESHTHSKDLVINH